MLYFHPELSGEIFSNLTCAYFFKWVGEKPPTRLALLVSIGALGNTLTTDTVLAFFGGRDGDGWLVVVVFGRDGRDVDVVLMVLEM